MSPAVRSTTVRVRALQLLLLASRHPGSRIPAQKIDKEMCQKRSRYTCAWGFAVIGVLYIFSRKIHQREYAYDREFYFFWKNLMAAAGRFFT